jgi:hypothetical protein
MSHIDDDINRHTDMLLEATTGVGKSFFAVDITYGLNGFAVKLAEHGKWQHDSIKI